MAQISPEVIDILRRSSLDGLRLTLPPRLDRDSYVKANMVLENLGGKWNRKAKAHVFTRDPAEALQAALAGGKIVDRKKELQFFPTPSGLAELMASLAEIKRGDCVLEPSAGHGAIAMACLDRGASVCAVEIDTENFETLMRLGVSPARLSLHLGDFLEWADDADGIEFDAIVMNPPFSNGQDIAHVLAAWNLLKIGGRLVAITSPGWQFRQTNPYTGFASWLKEHDAIVTELEPGTFKDSGTDVRTTLIVLKKEQGQ